jgi:phage shock protein PspC (stress-responsive transcriptional regulator)
VAFRFRHGDRPLEGYTVLRGIGRGGFGEVYYAMSDGGREVALKLIQQNHEIELRGVRQCMNLKSPHLVTIFDVRLSDDGIPFVIMEHVKGPSLRDILRGSPGGLDKETAGFFTREIGKGLEYLHHHGIVHRDLKPENIFFEDGYVKIGDYGLSKYISVSHQSGQTISVGSVHYMAPEIGSGNYQRSVDIYAVGVMLYELLSGRVPFNGNSMGEILMKHLSSKPDLEPIDRELRPVVERALAKDPSDRYASVSEMVEALLAQSGLGARIAGFDPSRFGAMHLEGNGGLAAGTDSQAATVQSPVPAAVVAQAAGRAEAPPEARRAAAAQSPPASFPPHAAPAGFFRSADLETRLFMGAITLGAMTLALWLFASGGEEVPAPHAFAIAMGVLPLLALEGWAVRRFRIERGTPRRLGAFALAGPPLALAMGASGLSPDSIPALLAGLLFVDWSGRCDPARPERVSFGSAIYAGVFGALAAACSGAFDLEAEPLLAGGILAAMSLVLNALSPFAGGAYRGKALPALAPTPSAPAPVPRVPPPVPVLAPRTPPPARAVLPASPPPPPYRSRLVRVEEGKVLAGVCAGLSARYQIDIAWVRLILIVFFLVTAGYGALAYLALWFCMPRAATAAAARPEPGPAVAAADVPPAAARAFWYVLWLVALAGGVPLLVAALRENWSNDETGAMIGGAVFLLLLSSFAFLKGSSRRRRPFWRGAGQPVLVIACIAAASGCAFWLAFGYPRSDEAVAALSAAIVTGVLAVFLGINWFAYLVRTPPEFRPPAAEPHPGWAALGKLLLTLAAVTLALGAFLDADVGRRLLAEAGVEMPAEIGEGWHLSAALVLFLPSFACLLVARRGGGAAHVARGALGWLLAGVIALWLAAAVSQAGAVPEVGSPPEVQPEIVHGGANLFVLVIVFALGVLATLCLAWAPRRHREGRTPSLPSRDGGPDAP